MDRPTADDASCRCSTATRRCRAWCAPEMRAGARRAPQGRRRPRPAPLAAATPPTCSLASATQVPEVGDYIDSVHFRLLEGFDLPNPTIGERPGAPRRSPADRTRRRRRRGAAPLRRRRGRAPCRGAGGAPGGVRRPARPRPGSCTACATSGASTARSRRSGSCASRCSSSVAASRQRRPGAGRRGRPRGRRRRARRALFAGADAPTAEELHERAVDRVEPHPRRSAPAPRPAAARPAAGRHAPAAAGPGDVSVGFLIDGILGQKEAPEGDATTIVGIPGAQGVVEGPVRLVRSIDDLFDLEPGDVLVAPTTGEAFNSMLHLVSAIVTDHGSFASPRRDRLARDGHPGRGRHLRRHEPPRARPSGCASTARPAR